MNLTDTHGPQISLHGTCRTCEFRKYKNERSMLERCTFVEPHRVLPENLKTPLWCPLLKTAVENYLAELMPPERPPSTEAEEAEAECNPN